MADRIEYSGKPTEKGSHDMAATSGNDALTITAIVTDAGTIRYDGTPNVIGTYSMPASGSDGRALTVVAEVTEGGGGTGSGPCYLLKFDRNGNKTQLDLDIVYGISDTITVNLTEISTIIYGFDRNVVMDLGTSERFNLKVIRNQPFDGVINDTNWGNQHHWSNGHWMKMVREFFADWQNLNRDGQGELMGGFKFHYEPMIQVAGDARELYPTIDRNVFLAGQVSFDFKSQNLQKLILDIPLAVGRMRQDTTSSTYTVAYIPNLTGASNVYRNYPLMTKSIAPNCPTGWLRYTGGKMFTNWIGGSTIYNVGSRVDSTVRSLTAQWVEPTAVRVCQSTTSTTYTVQAGDSKAVVYVVGGGGGGGGRAYVPSGYNYGGGNGGGGGSGDFINMTLLGISAGDTITISAGRAGAALGGKGGDSTVIHMSSDDTVISTITAAGGMGGARPRDYGKIQGTGGAAGGNGGNAGSAGEGTHNSGTGGTGGKIKLDGTIQVTGFNLDPDQYGCGGQGFSQTGRVSAQAGKKGAVVLLVYGSGA